MPFGLSCPKCQANFRLPDELAGRQVKCQRCGEVFRAPAPVEDEVLDAKLADAPAAASPAAREPSAWPQSAPARDFDSDPELPRRRRENRPPPRRDRTRRNDPWVILGIVGGVLLVFGSIVGAVLMVNQPRQPVVAWKGPPMGVKPMPGPGMFPGGNLPALPPLDNATAIHVPLVKGAFQGNFSLTVNDQPDPGRRNPGKLFLVEVEAGKTYVIDHKRTPPSMFDPYLRLEDPNGVPVAENDDSGGTLDSQIRFIATQAGSYRVIATTLSGGVGPFSLAIRDVTLPEPGPATPMPKPPIVPMPKLEAKDAIAPGVIQGKLTLQDRVEIGTFKRAGVQHVIQLEANASYRVAIESSKFKCIVFVVDDTGRILHTQSGVAKKANIMFRPPAAGNYRFVVAPLPQGDGDYTLTVAKQDGNRPDAQQK